MIIFCDSQKAMIPENNMDHQCVDLSLCFSFKFACMALSHDYGRLSGIRGMFLRKSWSQKDYKLL